jgi:hypothetical protein
MKEKQKEKGERNTIKGRKRRRNEQRKRAGVVV